MNRTLGIIGGMGPLATANLFNKIVLKTDAKTDQDHIHILIDNNIAIPDRTAYLVGKGENPLDELIKSAKRLENMGADFLIMPCNTAHYFYKEIKAAIHIEFLNMIEETVIYIKEQYPTSKKVGLLATDGTVQSGIYDLYFNKDNIEMVHLEKDSQDGIMNIIYSVKAGKNEIPLANIYSAVEELKSKGAEVVILGCTELSVVNEKYDLKGNIVDALNVITEGAIEFAGKKVVRK